MVAFAAPGDLDPTFGDRGTVSLPADGLSDVVVQPDGRIVVAASRQTGDLNGDYETLLVRFLPDGRLDPDFGTGGIVDDHSPAGPLALAADGGILVASPRCDGGTCAGTVRRYHANGQPDPAFGGGPVQVFAGTPTRPLTVVVQPDGKILVAGSAGHSPAWSVWIARLHADGTPDTGFGQNGLFADLISSHGSGLGTLLVQPDGSMVAGETSAAIETVYSDLRRLTAAGTPVAAASLGVRGPFIAAAPGGDIVVAGTVFVRDVGTHLGLERFTADLASGGPLGEGPAGWAEEVVVQSDGKPVVAAILVDDTSVLRRVGVVRWTADGVLDAAFGADGVVTPFASTTASLARMATQVDGKLVVAGISESTLELARILVADGSTTTTTTTPRGRRSTSTTSPSSGGSSTTRPEPTCAIGCDDGDGCTVDRCQDGRCLNEARPGFDAVTCRCHDAMPACSDRSLRRLGARVERACRLVDAAAQASSPRARRLVRRADRILGAADHRASGVVTHDRGTSCATDISLQVGDLRARSRALLLEMP
jgi:uncharacterized delta-60 repeat protein